EQGKREAVQAREATLCEVDGTDDAGDRRSSNMRCSHLFHRRVTSVGLPASSLDRVTRPAPTRALACLLAVVGALVGSLVLPPAPGAAEERASSRTPLRVTIETLAPATIPQDGRLIVSGTITNR